MNEPTRDELQDRMLETALEEKLGALQPPNISDKVTAKIAPEVTVAEKTVPKLWRSRRVVLTAIASTAVVAVAAVAVRQLGFGNSDRDWSRERFVSVQAEGAAQVKDKAMVSRGVATSEGSSLADSHRMVPLSRRADMNGDYAGEDQTIIAEGTTVQLPSRNGDDAKSAKARGPKLEPHFRDLLRDESKNRSTRDLDLGDGAQNPSKYWQQDDIDVEASVDKSLPGNRYAQLNDNPFLTATAAPLSTFSVDVDTASYSVLRTLIASGRQVPPPAVRIEELVNYFPYEYAQPADGTPFAVHVDAAGCPWQPKHRLVRIALKGREIAKEKRPPSNLVFLVDVSGSMGEPNKLPLVQHGLRRLVEQLDERDRVAIVVYAGNSGCVLPSTVCTGENKVRIQSSVASLASGGSTNGEAGIQLAYQIAQDHFVKDGSNRVILCTDGDFNVGTTSVDELKSMVADRAKRTGVFFTALGFGMGNLNDHLLESIADNGNGAYGYIDNEREVEKLFVKQLSGTLVTIAKDVKIQIEFNPAQVAGYRLIGYENRMLKKEDFNNDAKDAGDIGAGHTVTALYEIVPAGQAIDEPAKQGAKSDDAAKDAAAGTAANETGKAVDDLEFQKPKAPLEVTDAAKTSGDMMVVKLRYKMPDGDRSTLIRQTLKDAGTTFAAASSDFKFAASVAEFGMILRRSPYRGDLSLSAVEEIAAANVGTDPGGLRAEFVGLIRTVKTSGQ
jgi:Ca-activated chloride channel family protein